MSTPAPNARTTHASTGVLSSSDVYRIGATAAKLSDVFEAARLEARDEALWLSAKCQELITDNQWLRRHIETLEKENAELKKGQGNAQPSAGA